MNKEELKERIKVEQAYVDGAVIEFSIKYKDRWNESYSPTFNWGEYDYRVKSTPTYIPFTFKDRELFRGKWVVSKNHKIESCIIRVDEYSVWLIQQNNLFYKDLLEHYTFIDGTPCGKLQQNN